MCRILAYVGPEIPLTGIVCEPEHSLVMQSYKPRHMINGTVNVDGFGVGWYQPGDDPTPAVYRSVLPIWADANLASIGRKIRSPHILACVRGATGEQPTSHQNTQPFHLGRYSLIHNGSLQRFREVFMRPIRDALEDRIYQAIQGSTDSEHIFAAWLNHLKDRHGIADMADALRATAEDINTRAREAGVKTFLTLIVSDGESIVATRHGVAERLASLFVLDHGESYPDAVILASEPLNNDPGWKEVEPYRFITVDASRRLEILG